MSDCKLAFFIGFFALFISFSHHSKGQGAGVPIDRIIAKIDDYVILKSDLETAYINYLSSGNSPQAGAKCEILRQLLVNKVLVAKAEIDSVIVPDSRVSVELDRRLQMFIYEAGSPEKLEEGLGKSMEEIKDELLPSVREQLIVGEMRREITTGLKVRPDEVRNFFKLTPQDSIPFMPAVYEVGELVVYPTISKSAKEAAEQKLIDIRNKVLSGEDFAKLAKENSEDLGSAAQGGDLGFHGRGELVPEFEATAFRLKEGEISMPVESEFGFHLIQLIERRGNTFHARHILMSPEVKDSDFKESKKLLDSLYTLITEEKVSFADAAREFSESRNSKINGGLIMDPQSGRTAFTLDELPFDIANSVMAMSVGEVSEPLKYRSDDGKDAMRLLFFRNKVKPHKASLATDYEKIKDLVMNRKQMERVNTWFLNATDELYISIDKEYDECQILEGREK